MRWLIRASSTRDCPRGGPKMANQSVLVGGSPAEPTLELKARGLWSDAFRRLAKNRLALAGLVAVVTLAAVAFFPGIRRYDPYNDQDRANTYAGPSADHFLGTDNLGRDNWSRVVTGTRISLQVG